MTLFNQSEWNAQDANDLSAFDPETQAIAQQFMERNQLWRRPVEQAQVSPPEQLAVPEWWNQSPEDYLQENPPFNFHEDPEALTAIMPESPELPWFRDSSHPEHQSKVGKLLRLLAYGAMGGTAGAGSRTVGEGFNRGQQAGYNLMQLQMQRQQAKDLSNWRQAQTQRLQMQTQLMPQQAATLEDYRRARRSYLEAQSARIREQADALRHGKNDKLIYSYQGADGKMKFLFQHGPAAVYERSSEEPFYQKPQGVQRPLLAQGPDGGVYLISPDTRDARLVIPGKGKQKPRLASPQAFAHVEEYKTREWNKIQRDSLLSPEEKLNRLEDLQGHYEALVRTLGGSVIPYDVRSGTRPTQPLPQGQSFWSQVPGAVRRP